MSRRLRHAVLVTGNPGKAREAARLAGVELEHVAIDLPEIQSMDLREVLLAKADAAWQRLGRALIVEETGLELAGMNGFPGPLVKWMLGAIGPEGVARAAIASGDAGATARCRILLRDEAGDLVAEATTEGTLVLPPRGPHGFGWDPVFQPKGEHRTYGELSDEQKDAISHRGRAWRRLRRLGVG